MRKKSQDIKKQVGVHLLISALLLNSFPEIGHAQNIDNGKSSNSTFNTALSYIDGAMNTVGSVVATMQQQNMAMLQNQMAQAEAAKLAPKTTEAKYFPHCKVPWAISDRPARSCEAPNPANLAYNNMLVTTAEAYGRFYDEAESMGQNSPFPSGLQCVENGQKKVQGQMQDKINQIQQTIDGLQKMNQGFRDKHKEMQEQMRRLNVELEGGGDLAGEKSKDWKALFGDSSCSKVLSDSVLTNQGTGLRKILSSMNTPSEGGKKSLRDQANSIEIAQGHLQRDLEEQLKRIRTDIKQDGLDTWLRQDPKATASELTSSSGILPSKAIEDAIKAKQKSYQSKMKSIAAPLESLKKYNYNLPEFDENYESKVRDFRSGAMELFRKQYVDDCVLGKGKIAANNEDRVAIDSKGMLDNLEYEGSKGGESSRTKEFQSELKAILGQSDVLLEDKMHRIALLEKRQGGRIKTKLKKGPMAPSALLQDTIHRCNAKFTQNQTFNPSAPNQKSPQQEIEEGLRAIDKATALQKTMASEITQAIHNQVMNCVDNEAATCDSKSMDSASPNFCINTATRCAQNIKECGMKANNLVRDREQKLKNMETAYNSEMEKVITFQNTMLSAMNQRVMQDSEFFKQYFPGATFLAPDDLVLKVPEMEMVPDLGVRLRGKPDLKFLEENLKEQLLKLKNKVTADQEKINKEIADYINTQKEAISKNRQFWSGIGSKCKSVVDATNAANAQQMQEMMKKQNEFGQNLYTFCHNYRGMRASTNTAAGCTGSHSPESLYTDAAKVMAYIHPEVIYKIREYKNICAQAQNSGQLNNMAMGGSGKDGSDPMMALARVMALERMGGNNKKSGDGETPNLPTGPGLKIHNLCKGNGLTDKALATRLFNEMIPSLPSGMNMTVLRDYVEGKGSKNDLANLIDPDFAQSVSGQQLANLRRIGKGISSDGFSGNGTGPSSLCDSIKNEDKERADTECPDTAAAAVPAAPPPPASASTPAPAPAAATSQVTAKDACIRKKLLDLSKKAEGELAIELNSIMALNRILERPTKSGIKDIGELADDNAPCQGIQNGAPYNSLQGAPGSPQFNQNFDRGFGL